MKKVGEILRSQRVKYKLTLEEISRKTKIQEKYLESLEKDDYKHLPTSTFVKGFIQNYAKAIGLDANTALAIFRRDFIEDNRGRIIPRSLLTPIENKVTISPKTMTVAIFSGLTVLILAIFFRQIINFYQGPEVFLEKPQEDQTITSPFEIAGKAKNVVNLQINNQETDVNQEGNFSREIQLSPGDHTITVTGTSKDGKTKTMQRRVIISQ